MLNLRDAFLEKVVCNEGRKQIGFLKKTFRRNEETISTYNYYLIKTPGCIQICERNLKSPKLGTTRLWGFYYIGFIST